MHLISIRKEQYDDLLVPIYDWYMTNKLYENLPKGTEGIGSSWHGVTTKTVDGLKATVARSRKKQAERTSLLKAIYKNWNRTFFNAIPANYQSGRFGTVFVSKFKRFTKLCTTYEQAWGSGDQPGILPPIIAARIKKDFHVLSNGLTLADLTVACDMLLEEQVDDGEEAEDTRMLRGNADQVAYGGMTLPSSKRPTSKRSTSKAAARSETNSTKASKSSKSKSSKSKGHNDANEVPGTDEPEDTNNIDASTRVSNNDSRSLGSNTGSEPSAQHSAEQADGPPTDLSAFGPANNVGDSGSSDTRPNTEHTSRVVEGNAELSGEPQTTAGVGPLSSGLSGLESGQDNQEPPRQGNQADPSHSSPGAH